VARARKSIRPPLQAEPFDPSPCRVPPSGTLSQTALTLSLALTLTLSLTVSLALTLTLTRKLPLMDRRTQR